MALLQAIMIKMGFSPRFTNTVMRCVTLVTFSVLFNGGSLDAFMPSRGLRQGDPISSYLFLLAAEGLSCLFKSQHGVQGLAVAPSAPRVNHLLFADDSLLFFEANDDAATRVNELLIAYCNASGQKINVEKISIFFSKGVSDATKVTIKNILEVHNESLLGKTLYTES